MDEEGEIAVYRGWRSNSHEKFPVLVLAPAQDPPLPHSLERLAQEYALKDLLEAQWAARPLELARLHGRSALLLEDPGGEPLSQLIAEPMEPGQFLRLAVAITAAVVQVHRRGLIHKDIKPAHILVDEAQGKAWLTNFGIASRIPSERTAPEAPEAIAGSLAYMAPEQTGRMNRSVDARADLYALGVTLYRMLTGVLPFTAADPMEWVHCHIARLPTPPEERVAGLPSVLSAIVMKCLAKTAEDRYQTATGLAADLRCCLDQWEETGAIALFSPGTRDIPDHLRMPEKLYGREREVATLLEAFDRVVAQGRTELALVGGYAGIGKSSVVNELHRALVPPRGLFAAGKFDQLKRDIPYATLAQAFQGLIRLVLGKPEAEFRRWREDLRAALEPNGALMVNLVPDLKLIIGDQPPVPDLPPQDAEYRFQLVFRRFVGVFARTEHPLALFLDDLQWLDTATLSLLADLATNPEMRHLLLVGAYRDNEVDAAHPLRRTLDAARLSGGVVHDIVLAPLQLSDVLLLIADTLCCATEAAAPLAQLIHGKTGGNPFFTLQFLTALAEEKLLAFDPGRGKWVWDLERIEAKGCADNVADLMVVKFARLPEDTRDALKLFACLGNVTSSQTLAFVLGQPVETVHTTLWEAVRAGLVFRCNSDYVFLHDRIQEAAYSLITEEERGAVHLRIGRVLLSGLSSGEIAERIFDVVNQLNYGRTLVGSLGERERTAELNLMAGRRARASMACTAALKYFAIGAGLLAEDCWERRYDLAFALAFHRAECEFLTGAVDEAENRLAKLSTLAGSALDKAKVTCLRIDLYTAQYRPAGAVALGLKHLRQLGFDWSPHPADAEVLRECELIWTHLGNRAIEDLVDLPCNTDPTSLAIVDVLIRLVPAAAHTDANLTSLLICCAVNLSLKHGNSSASCFAYTHLATVLGHYFGNYETAFRFGRMGYVLAERPESSEWRVWTYFIYARFVLIRAQHIRGSANLLQRTMDIASEIGDFTSAFWCFCGLNSYRLAAGTPLADLQHQLEQRTAFSHTSLFREGVDPQIGLVRTLRGLTANFGYLFDHEDGESRLEERLSSNPSLSFHQCFYWLRKMQARYFAGDYTAAMQASSNMQKVLWTSKASFEAAEYHFYSALSHAASCESASAEQRLQHLEAITAHHRQLGLWAENCPETFENRVFLVGAEIARLEDRGMDALRLYERAIRSARDNGFVNNEALASELAARFCLDHDLATAGLAYLRDARACYVRWGADGKVRQLDWFYRGLTTGDSHLPAENGTAALRQMDAAAVIKASQALASEIELPKLIKTLMTIVLQDAGADHGLLILPRGGAYWIEAEAWTRNDTVEVAQCRIAMTESECPEALLRTVIRSKESIVLDDVARSNMLGNDAYLGSRAPRSVYCLPLVRQAKLAGVLYVENTQATHAFTPARVAPLGVLATQAAVALENARLYGDLQEREARIRRLVDSNIIGIFLWDFEGRIHDANEAFLQMVGYDRDDLLRGCLRWRDLTPAEWLTRDEEFSIPELRTTGRLPPLEKEYIRKDGRRVPILLGAAVFEESPDQGVAFVLDLSERKAAERALQQAKLEAERANAAKSHFLASASHDIRQPAQALMLLIDTLGVVLAGQPAARVVVQMAIAGEALKGLLDGLLDISRLHAGLVQPRMEASQLGPILERLAEEYRPRVMQKGLTLRLVPARAWIWSDPVLIERILRNLIDNAFKYTETGKILLGCRHCAGHLRFEIHDTGIGIPADQIEAVFDEFYQLNNPSRDRTHGLGLGLTVVRRLADLLGITVGVKSQPGRGSCFSLDLQLEAEELDVVHRE